MTPGLLPPLVKAAAAKYGSYGQPKQPCSAHSAGGYGQPKKPFSAIDLPPLPPPPLVSQVMEFLVTDLRTNIIFEQAHLEESLINLLQIFSTSSEYLNYSSLLLQAQMDKQ